MFSNHATSPGREEQTVRVEGDQRPQTISRLLYTSLFGIKMPRPFELSMIFFRVISSKFFMKMMVLVEIFIKRDIWKVAKSLTFLVRNHDLILIKDLYGTDASDSESLE